MRKYVAGSLIAAASLISVILWHENRAEREVNRQLRAELLDMSPPVAVLGVPEALPAAQLGPAGRTSMVEEVKSSTLALPVSDHTGNRNLLDDPAYRRARVMQISLALRETYPWLASELGLTQGEEEELFLFLAESRLEQDGVGSIAASIVSGGQVTSPVSQEMMNSHAQVERGREEGVRSLLGESRYAEWRNYNDNLVALQQVFNLGRSYEAAGLPSLNDHQRRAMADAYISELNLEKAISSQLQAEFSLGPAASEARLLQLSQDAEKQREGRVARILDAAERHLSQAQVQVLASALRQQLVVQQERKRAQRTRAAARGLLLPGEMYPMVRD